VLEKQARPLTLMRSGDSYDQIAAELDHASPGSAWPLITNRADDRRRHHRLGWAGTDPEVRIGALEVTVQIAAIPPLVAHVRALPGDVYLRREVADALDVSPATLDRLAELDRDLLGPTHETYYGVGRGSDPDRVRRRPRRRPRGDRLPAEDRGRAGARTPA